RRGGAEIRGRFAVGEVHGILAPHPRQRTRAPELLKPTAMFAELADRRSPGQSLGIRHAPVRYPSVAPRVAACRGQRRIVLRAGRELLEFARRGRHRLRRRPAAYGKALRRVPADAGDAERIELRL